MAENKEKEGTDKTGPGIVATLGVFAAISVFGLALGWFLSGHLQSSWSAKVAMVDALSVDLDMKNSDEGAKSYKNIGIRAGDPVHLDPILVMVEGEGKTFVRLELVVIPHEDEDLDDETTKLKLNSELSSFIRTLNLDILSGPSGYLHFREDILDRIQLSTQGRAKDVLIMSLVAE